MGQEPEAPEKAPETPAEGQEPEAPKEGQELQGKPEGEPETFDKEYVKTLRAEAAKHRKEAQEAKAKAQEYEDAQKSELEKAQGKLTTAEKAKADAEAKLLRYEVAQEKEVPAKLVPLLTASTKDDLEIQADLILENAKPANADFDGGPRDPAPKPQTPEQAHGQFLVDMFQGKTLST